MKMFKISSLVILLLSGNSIFCQSEVLIKNNLETRLVLNNDHTIQYKKDLKLLFNKVDTLSVLILAEGSSSKKKILLQQSRNYEVIKTGENKFKLRLRSNAHVGEYDEILLDTLKPMFKPLTSFLFELGKEEHEFDKVSLLIKHVRETDVNSESLAVYLNALSHDFSKWQVIEIVLSEKLIRLDYDTINRSFDSDVYKERLKQVTEKQ